jgi:transcriptional regulator with XRE-family HTH domain
MYYGKNLRELRTTSGLTLKQLGKGAGVHVRTLNRLEKGEGNPKINTLTAVANYFKMTVDELFLKIQENKTTRC